MTSQQISLVLSTRHDLRQEMLIPNVSWGLVSWGECDLLSVSNAGYITEYEIKLTLADFKREWRKKRWVGIVENPEIDSIYARDFRKMVKSYYIVVPKKLTEKITPLIPEQIGAGIIEILEERAWKDAPLHRWANEVKPAVANRKAGKLTDEQRIRLGYWAAMRYWNLARKINGNAVQ